ncbi:hypothetical protein JHK82_055731 [Glycine max]|nr:hypothetical protein JHK82_055731 [Glycine max]
MLKLTKRRNDELQFRVKRGEEILMVPISNLILWLVTQYACGQVMRFQQMVIGGEGRMLATLVRTNTNLAERSGLLERLIEKPISYIDITVLLSSSFICGKDGNNSGLPETKGKVSIGLLMKAIERAFLRPQGTVSILTRDHDVAILCMQHGMPLVVIVSLKYQTDKVVPNQDAVPN